MIKCEKCKRTYATTHTNRTDCPYCRESEAYFSMNKFKSTKAAAWSLAGSYLQDTLYEETGVEPAIYEHILDAVVPALKRKAQIIERKHRDR